MPFEKGNKHGEKSREFERMVQRALIQDDYKRLRAGVEAMLDEAANGERWALELIRDTLDGKPKQTVSGTLETTSTITHRVEGLSETDEWVSRLTGRPTDSAVPESRLN